MQGMNQNQLLTKNAQNPFHALHPDPHPDALDVAVADRVEVALVVRVAVKMPLLVLLVLLVLSVAEPGGTAM